MVMTALTYGSDRITSVTVATVVIVMKAVMVMHSNDG